MYNNTLLQDTFGGLRKIIGLIIILNEKQIIRRHK